jgi:hypothetical protein
MLPKMKTHKHRADRRKSEERIAELKRQLAEYAKKSGGLSLTEKYTKHANNRPSHNRRKRLRIACKSDSFTWQTASQRIAELRESRHSMEEVKLYLSSLPDASDRRDPATGL